ncbi:MAG: 7-carboxy-7-deazaguanine synthase QueE [Desulfurellaceae bacterium]|nr:7-carboxy-7-deazaguanine synthase QueE [Desulfurellaceae bacterium]
MTTPPDRLLVSEIFESVQGEGVSLGVPSVFLRLAHCNLRCGWCDTKYTWDWHAYDIRKEVREYSLDQTVDALQRLRPRNLVVTGGEPLLQQPALVSLLRRLEGWTSEVETAGTLVPDARLTAITTRWNVSPKLDNSGNPTDKRLRPEALRAFAALPNASFKFVLTAASDLAEVSDLIARFDLPSERVMLMPEATEAGRLNALARDLVEACIQYGYRLSYRLHVALWGAKRGV